MKNSNKNFGIVFSVFFIILFIYFYFQNQEAVWYFLFISLVFLILGLLNSKLLTPLNKFWIKLGEILGKIIAPIIMAIVYFLIAFPTKLYLKLINKDILGIEIDKNSESFWKLRHNIYNNMDNQF